jgi:very-short-patch-repair endonuclease
VVGLVTAAISARLTSAVSLAGVLGGRSRARWRKLLRDLLDDGEGIESPLEWRYVRDVERPHGLPTAERQQVVKVGGRRQRRDAVYRAQRVVIELDGRLGHQSAGAFRDMRRDNAAAARGEVTLRYGWMDVVGRPCEVARQIADILRRRGWLGTLLRCPNCV